MDQFQNSLEGKPCTNVYARLVLGNTFKESEMLKGTWKPHTGTTGMESAQSVEEEEDEWYTVKRKNST